MSRIQSDQVALANDGSPSDPRWETWAKNAIATGAIVPPYDMGKRIPWLALSILLVTGLGIVGMWLRWVK